MLGGWMVGGCCALKCKSFQDFRRIYIFTDEENREVCLTKTYAKSPCLFSNVWLIWSSVEFVIWDLEMMMKIFYFHTEISVNHVLLAEMYQSSLVCMWFGVEYCSEKFVAGFNFPQEGKY